MRTSGEDGQTEGKIIELEERQGVLAFAVYSCSAGGNRILLECFPTFELASQRFPEARLNGVAHPDLVFSQNTSRQTN